jgi:serine protease Do
MRFGFNHGVLLLAFNVLILFQAFSWGQVGDFVSVVAQVQPKMVKINGSGGFRGLESYQSGFLISSEGHILTVWSHVLDSDVVIATLHDGQSFEARLLGYDPRTEIAILKLDVVELPFFDIEAAVPVQVGEKVLAFSNLYGVATGNESTSVLHGIVTAATRLSARSGATKINYQGEIYVVDAMTNNPGAAGGAMTNRLGQLTGMIGKELKDSQTNTWLNFAIPISELAGAIGDIRSGKMIVDSTSSRKPPREPMSDRLLGFVLVPDVIARTPPFIDQVTPGSPFDRAGIQRDDLIVEINGRLTPSCKDVSQLLSQIDRDATINVTIQRGRTFLSVEIQSYE